jgi:hypothetical protein
MAGSYEEHEIIYSMPVLHHDLSVDEIIAPPIIKPYEFSGLRAQVDEIIDRGFSDMWLLLDGEEFERDFASGIWRDGRAFAMVTGNQISLLSSKFSAINALLSVGVSMSE